jgi:hypothetical protein
MFERFVDDSPVCVMVQTLLENTSPPTTGSEVVRSAIRTSA